MWGHPYPIDTLRELVCCPFVLPLKLSKAKLADRMSVEGSLRFLDDGVVTVDPDRSMIMRDRKG
jgi:hypothetical protein